ncbi:MAG: hypothetical protein Q8O86_00780, partial [Dehalococcoidia bacterium]|nr:hypothetical protein [Dehalococcoidia bacterium]
MSQSPHRERVIQGRRRDSAHVVVPVAHVLPTKSSQLRGVNFELVSFTNTKPGQNPTVQFSVKDKAGNPIAPSEMARIAFTLAGPTTEYQTEPPVRELANDATAVGGGAYSYTFQAKIPSGASGSWAVGV